MKNISIIGSGSWGSALAIHLAKLGNNVKMWSFSEEEAELINNQKKCKFLPEATMPQNIICTTDFKTAIEETEMLLIVTPSKFVRETIMFKRIWRINIIHFKRGSWRRTSELQNRRIIRTKPCWRSITWNPNSPCYCIKRW